MMPGPSEAVEQDMHPVREDVEQDTHPVREAAKVAAIQAEETGGLGRLGRPMDRRSPFFIGMAGAAGVAVTIGLVELAIKARSVLVLIGLALFIAIGLDPVVAWLTRRRIPRWTAVVIILLAGVGIAAGFVMAAVPPLVTQAKLLAVDGDIGAADIGGLGRCGLAVVLRCA